MKTFLFKFLLFILISLILIFSVTKILSLQIENLSFKNYESEENLFTIHRKKHYDILFMGISHARNFTRFKNHERVERILNSKIINIGRGGGKCGAEGQYIYLKHFFSRGNTAKRVIYIPSAPIMFSESLDINSSIFEYEPFRVQFFMQYLFSDSKNKKQQLYYYLRYKYKPQWKKFKPFSLDSNKQTLARYDSAAVEEGFKLAYPKGLDSLIFEKNKRIIRKTIELCEKNNSQIIFMMTPAMFGEWPGNDRVFAFLKDIQKKHSILIYDYSVVCKDSTLYFDHHHMNSKGINWFAERYIRPILEE